MTNLNRNLPHPKRVDSLSPRKVKIPSTPARKTSKFFDKINNLDPMKFSPPTPVDESNSRAMHERHLTYSSVTNMNPFNDEARYTRIADFIDQDCGKTPTGLPKLSPKSYKPREMIQSRSEGNLSHRPGVSGSSSGSQFTNLLSSSDDDHVRFSEDTMTSTLSRGRSYRRANSPMKELEDIQEIQAPDTQPPPPSTPKPKRSRSPMKRMFGERGWLGKSMSMHELPSEEYRKTGLKHWGGKIKDKVGNFTENVAKSVPKGLGDSPSKSRSPPRSTFYVTLSPPMQAKLYSELELMICATANQYLNTQLEQDRMSIESVQKVQNYWQSKNRPQVIEFMYDQATQRDLIQYNMKNFRFYGPNGNSLMAMASVMQAWKVLAREMAVRTFCTPDSVIKKHLFDTYRILEMLGAPFITFLAFQEISLKATKIMKDGQKRKEDQKSVKFGVEKKWEPAKRDSKEMERLDVENPFA